MQIVLVDENSKVPEYSREGDAGVDFFARCDATWERTSFNDSTALVNLGVKMAIPKDHVLLIFSRSGHGFKHGISLANCVGVIDSNYRGEICVKLTCAAENTIDIKKGDRVAQGILFELPRMYFDLVKELPISQRGENGFGSSGN